VNSIESLTEVAPVWEAKVQSASGNFALSTSAVIALILSMLIVGVSFGAVAPLVSAILENRGFSEYFTGSVTATLSLAIALSSTWVGKLVERYGTRRINVLGVSGQALGFAGLGLALMTNEALLFPVRFGLGVAATMTFIATEVALLRGVAEAVRGRVMAAYGSGFAVGFMLGVFASDLSYEWFGLWCFGLVACIAALFVPLAWRGMRGEIGAPMPSFHDSASTKAKLTRFNWQPSWMALFGAVVFGALDTAISGTYPVEGQRLGLTRSETLRIVGIMAFGMVAGQPFAGWLADKFGARRPIAAVTMFGILCCFVAGAISQHMTTINTFWIAAAFCGIGIAIGSVYPISLKVLADRTVPENLPLANARFSTLYGYAALIGPLLAASGIDAMERLGYLGWAVPSVSALTLAIMLALVWRDKKLRI